MGGFIFSMTLVLFKLIFTKSSYQNSSRIIQRSESGGGLWVIISKKVLNHGRNYEKFKKRPQNGLIVCRRGTGRVQNKVVVFGPTLFLFD
ncbi:hypothetical protein HgNV_022 [Homarus gammarus nudivirus]|uniref:Uncharacterized protein n=1 Tax=Homarus gammarus nudivirus TaxID=2509616 RepID=A0A411HB71_9VIRU|nr:hypothetical protein KM727_gp22 [Homarus gammarus nudivirus]QBB28627.1 hypothetical protein HgNV_022 [Homarus gammarus nudivirus]